MTLVIIWTPCVSFQLQCIVFEVGAVGVMGGWIEKWGKRRCWSLAVMRTIVQSGATLLFGQHTGPKGLCAATELYKPSLNEYFSPGHVPLHYITVEIVKITSIYISLLSVTLSTSVIFYIL